MKFVFLLLFLAFGASATKPGKNNTPPSERAEMPEEESGSMEEESESSDMEEESGIHPLLGENDLENFYRNPGEYREYKEVFIFESAADLETFFIHLPNVSSVALLAFTDYDSSKNKIDPNNPDSRRNKPCAGFSRIPDEVFSKLTEFIFIANKIDERSMEKFHNPGTFAALEKLELKDLEHNEDISPWAYLFCQANAKNFRNLRILELKGDWITSLESFINTDFENLETLALEENIVNLRLMKRGRFPNLTELRLSLNDNANMLSQCYMPKLKHLHFDKTQYTDQDNDNASDTLSFVRGVLPRMLFQKFSLENPFILSLDAGLENKKTETYIKKRMKNIVQVDYEDYA